jgi:hypothetical protein
MLQRSERTAIQISAADLVAGEVFGIDEKRPEPSAGSVESRERSGGTRTDDEHIPRVAT